MPVKFMVQIQVSKQILIELGKHATHEFQTEKICNTFQMKLLAFDIGDIIGYRFYNIELQNRFKKVLSNDLNELDIFLVF